MKSHYCVDGYRFYTEVFPNRPLVQVKVKLPDQQILNYSTTKWSILNELLPKHVIQSIENMIRLDTNIFIKGA